MCQCKKYLILSCAVPLVMFSFLMPCSAKTRVFLLAGQSNMAGQGNANELTGPFEPYSSARNDIPIWRSYQDENNVVGTTNGWVPLAPEKGSWYVLRNDPEFTSRWFPSFGPSVSFGTTIKDAYPGDDIYLIEHAWGATSLASAWDPDGFGNWNSGNSAGVHQDSFGVQYYHFRNVVTAALADLDANNVDYEISAMLWMQGESDAVNASRDVAYQANLESFIADIRSNYGQDLPFIIGRINPIWGGESSATRAAQQSVAESTAGVEWFDTDNFPTHGNNTNVHYNTEGQIQLGQAFAESYQTHFVPEPTAFALAMLSFLGLGVFRKRHNT